MALGGRLVAGQRVAHLVVGRPVPLHGRARVLWVDDVLGHVDEHRAGPAGRGQVEGLAHGERDVLRGRDQLVVLGDRAGDADRVALLEGVGADGGQRHLAGDAHDRDGVHVGVAQRGDDVGGRRAARHHGHAGTAGGVGVALRHVPGALLVAHEDVADRAVDDRVVDGQDRTAGQPEDGVDALHLEGSDERLSSGQLHGCSW